jgi:hypothetical protein
MLRVARTCSPLSNSPLRSTALPVSAIAPIPVDHQGNSEGTEAVTSIRDAIVESGRTLVVLTRCCWTESGSAQIKSGSLPRLGATGSSRLLRRHLSKADET